MKTSHDAVDAIVEARDVEHIEQVPHDRDVTLKHLAQPLHLLGVFNFGPQFVAHAKVVCEVERLVRFESESKEHSFALVWDGHWSAGS